MDTNIKTQKFAIRDLLNVGWQLYRGKFKNILLVILCVYLPFRILESFIPVASLAEVNGFRNELFYRNMLIFLNIFISTIVTIGIASMVEKSLEGENISCSDMLCFGFSKCLPAIGTGLLGGIIIFGFTLLLIIPGIIWSLYYTFVVYVVALRNISGKTALDYSKNLVEGQWWQVFGTFFVIGIIGMILGDVIIFLANHISTNQFFNIIPNIISDLIYTFITVIIVVFFLNNDYLKHPTKDLIGQSASSSITSEADLP